MTIIYKSGNTCYLGKLLNNKNSETPIVAFMTNRLSYGKFEPKFNVANVTSEYIINFEKLQDVITEIKTKRDMEIAELMSQLKSTKRVDYSDEIEQEYNRLKTEILRNAKNMLNNEIDDDSFENRLKSICEMKKKLFSIPCDEAREARKFNGIIKYKIKKINDEYDKQMQLLDLDSWNKLIG